MAVGIINLFVYIYCYIEAFGITLQPSPTANCKRYNSLLLTCSINGDWSFVAFNLELDAGTENIAAFTDNGGSCKDNAAPTPGLYQTSCDYNTKTFYLTINNVTDRYHGKFIECTVIPGNGRIITTINVQSSFELTSSPEKAAVGVDFTFTCTTSVSQVVFQRDQTTECQIYGVKPDGTCQFGVNNPNYKYDCDRSNGVYKLTIPSSFDIDTLHGSNWKCVDAVNGDESEPITLYVYISITQVDITAIPTDKNPIEIISGTNQTFKSETDAGRPSSRIQWFISGTNITELANPTENTTSGNKFISSSTLTYTGNVEDEGKIIYCTAVNIKGQSVISQNKSLVIWYPPSDTLSIQQIPAGGIVRGNVIKLMCTVTGGSPLAILTWDCDGTISNETTGNIASYSVTFVANRTSNNKICTCSASHVVLSYKPSMSHQLIVYYEPIYYPIINQTPPGHIISGTNVILTCEILGGNPLAILSWNCTGVSRNNTSVNKASYSVEIVVSRTFNNIICACSATHYIPSFRPTVRHMLDVYFKPFLDNTIPYSPSNISATENKKLKITLAINANPKPTIQWIFKADTGCNFSSLVSNTTTNGFLTLSSISIDRVRSSNFGEYTFTANNTVGIFFRRFEVIKEASKQEMCAYAEENTSIFVVGIVTLVVGLLSLSASVIFIVRNSFRNKTIKSLKSDEYTGVQKENPAFVDEYTTIQSEIEPRQPQKQSSNTYEECERKTEANPYSNVNTIGSEAKHHQGHAIGSNTYEECGRNFEAHAYDTLDK